jgi:hypothetical protein
MAPTPTPTLVDNIIKLWKANLSEDFLKKYISSTDSVKDLTAEDIVKLRNAGLPENLISFVTERKQLSASVPAAGAAPAPMPAAVATARGSGVRTRRWRSSLPSSGLSTRTSSPRKSRWTRSKGEKRERVRPLSRSFGGALASGRYFFAGGWGRRISSQSNAAESVRSSVAPLNRSFGDSAYAKTNLSSFAPFFQTARGTASA